MLPKVFVTGSWEERAKIHDIMNKLQDVCEITHDWTIHEDETLLNNKVYLKCQALLAEDGITRADYLIAIMDSPNYSYIGTWTEIGIAIGSDITVLLYNPIGNRNNIYNHHHCIKTFSDMNDIVKYLST